MGSILEFTKTFILPYYIDEEIALRNNGSLDLRSPSAVYYSLHSNYQPFYIFVAIYCFISLVYLSIGAAFVVIEQFDWLRKYKINAEKNTPEDYYKCLKNLFLNMVIFIPVMLVTGWPILSTFIVDVNPPIEQFPSLGTVILHILVSLYIEDFAHYVLHRFMHIPYMYKLIHKKHHEFQISFALAGNYAHPIETALLSIATFSPIVLIPNMHLFTFYLWITLRWADAAFEHSGYNIVPHFLPFQGGVAFHDYHHSQFNYNFGSRFTYWDKLFGTYSDQNTKKHQKETKRKIKHR
jgi:sterol desaturase/sphingolipid hydroxylase (fatty acid hydroxylase superfamily)